MTRADIQAMLDEIGNELAKLAKDLHEASGRIAAKSDDVRTALSAPEPEDMPYPRLVWPVQFDHVLVSPYGVERTDFTHEGIDIRAPLRTPVLAAADGQVLKVYIGRFYGNCIVLRHFVTGAKTYLTYYAHLDSWSVAQGQMVKARDVIGLSGNSGNSSAPHLHLTLVEEGNTKKLRGISLLGCVDPIPNMTEEFRNV